MEQSCVVSHGCMSVLRDRLFYNSDRFCTYLCNKCGFLAIANVNSKTFVCKSCGQNAEIVGIHIPYACKLLFQELMSMGISVKMFTKE